MGEHDLDVDRIGKESEENQKEIDDVGNDGKNRIIQSSNHTYDFSLCLDFFLI